jgi:creatinine amidohydrolase
MQTVKMGEMTVNEITEYLEYNQTIILPYGLAEQHGYHQPLDTDIRNADFLGEKLARSLGCIVAPTLNYCFSGGTLPGTINIKPNTFSNLIGEIIESLSGQGFKNFIILPGHGGSEALLHLKESLRILKWLNPALHDSLILVTPPWDYSPTWIKLFTSRDYHAAEAELSLLLHWCPEVVRDKIVMDAPEVAERLRQDPDSYQLREALSDDPHEIVTTTQRADVKIGVMGRPEKACAETGAKIEAEIIHNFTENIRKTIASAVAARSSGKRVVLDDNEKMKIMS